MKLIYIAGAFSAPDDEGRARNTAAAMTAGEAVMSLGAGVLVPHLALGPYYGRIPESVAMEICREMVRRADAVYIYDERHYIDSKGTHEEARLAHSLRLPVFVSFERVREWLEQQERGGLIGRIVRIHDDQSFDVAIGGGKEFPWEKQPRPPR